MKSVSSSSPLAPGERASHHGAKGVHDDDRRIGRLDLLHDGLQHLRHPSVERLLAEVDEANRAVAHLGGVEERVLLLIAKHLDGRFADDAEVHGLSLGARVREHDLMRERRLAAPWAAGDQVEGELRDPAAQDFVEARALRRAICESKRCRSFLVSAGGLVFDRRPGTAQDLDRQPLSDERGDQLEKGSKEGGGHLGRGGGV